MSTTSFRSLATTAAAFGTLSFAGVLGAQSARPAELRAIPAAMVRTAAMTPRVVASYAFRTQAADVALPYLVTVADSAGTLVAQASIRGQTRDIPMEITVLGPDLVLQGMTDHGVLTVVLDGQHEGSGTHVARGRWTLGKDGGALFSK